jgi:hypothetical protein
LLLARRHPLLPCRTRAIGSPDPTRRRCLRAHPLPHPAVAAGDAGASKAAHDSRGGYETSTDAVEDHGGGTICGYSPGDYVSDRAGGRRLHFSGRALCERGPAAVFLPHPTPVLPGLLLCPPVSQIKSIVFGGLDGIITTFAIIASVAGANLPVEVVIVTGFAKLLGDGLAMGFGDCMSEQAEHQHIRGEHKRETWEMDKCVWRT